MLIKKNKFKKVKLSYNKKSFNIIIKKILKSIYIKKFYNIIKLYNINLILRKTWAYLKVTSELVDFHNDNIFFINHGFLCCFENVEQNSKIDYFKINDLKSFNNLLKKKKKEIDFMYTKLLGLKKKFLEFFIIFNKLLKYFKVKLKFNLNCI